MNNPIDVLNNWFQEFLKFKSSRFTFEDTKNYDITPLTTPVNYIKLKKIFSNIKSVLYTTMYYCNKNYAKQFPFQHINTQINSLNILLSQIKDLPFIPLLSYNYNSINFGFSSLPFNGICKVTPFKSLSISLQEFCAIYVTCISTFLTHLFVHNIDHYYINFSPCTYFVIEINDNIPLFLDSAQAIKAAPQNAAIMLVQTLHCVEHTLFNIAIFKNH